jgi:magnesium transporter
MIKSYAAENGRLRSIEDGPERLETAAWIDLLSPTPEEESFVEGKLKINIPTRAEMEEIEVSSRLYLEDEAAFMTATMLAHTDRDDVVISPVTFVVAGPRLITVRYDDPRAFQVFPQRAEKSALGTTSPHGILMGLLETVVERLADILERAAREIDGISRNVFQPTVTASKKSRDFQKVLEGIGRKGDLLSNIRDSLMTFERLFAFLDQVVPKSEDDPAVRTRLGSLVHDGRFLTHYADFLSQKNAFLLNATLGMINIEQNAIIKIFSVAAVVFLPPTLIASVYGMNFEHMPELDWLLGYPAALVLLIVSAALPLWFFKRRGWL